MTTPTEEDHSLAAQIIGPRRLFAAALIRAQQDAGHASAQPLDYLAPDVADDAEAYAKAFSVARVEDWLSKLATACIEDRIVKRGFARTAAIQTADAVLIEYQGLVDPNSPFVDSALEMEGIGWSIEHVVRIDIDGTPAGTGFLIRPDLVLTAGHVIATPELAEPLLDEMYLPLPGSRDRIGLVLSDRLSRVGLSIKRIGQDVPLADDWLLKIRCPSGLVQNRTDSNHHLDYALLRLSAAAGIDLRGLEESETQPFSGDQIKVFQHPDKMPLKHDNGPIHGVRADWHKFFHEVNTLGGSSGGPCLDSSFKLVGIHQGTVKVAPPEEPELKYKNAAILILPVLEDAKDALDTYPDTSYRRYIASEDGRVAPLIGREETQDWIRDSISDGTRRIATVTGPKGTGKTYTIDILRALLPQSRHWIVDLSADQIQQDSPRQLAARFLQVPIHHDLVPPESTGDANLTGWLKRELVPGVAAALDRRRNGRTVWIVLDDLDIDLPRETGIRALLDLLYLQAATFDWLRFVLLGYGATPPREIAHLIQPITVEPCSKGDVIDFVEEHFRSEGRLGDLQAMRPLIDKVLGDMLTQGEEVWMQGVSEFLKLWILGGVRA